MLYVSWNSIVNEFDSKYDSVFQTSSSKAHFDLTGMVIDGPKDRWRHILLLDTLLCICSKLQVDEQDSRKRKFNQYAIFRVSVVNACSKAYVLQLCNNEYLNTSTTNINESNLSNSSDLDFHCNVVDIPVEWSSNDLLRHHLTNKKACKSWKRILQNVNDCFDNYFLSQGGIVNVINTAVNCMYNEAFIGGKRHLKYAMTQIENPTILDFTKTGINLSIYTPTAATACLQLNYLWEKEYQHNKSNNPNDIINKETNIIDDSNDNTNK